MYIKTTNQQVSDIERSVEQLKERMDSYTYAVNEDSYSVAIQRELLEAAAVNLGLTMFEVIQENSR